MNVKKAIFSICETPQIMKYCYGTLPKKNNGKMWEFFPSRGPPLPPVWEFFPDFTVYFWEVSHVKTVKKMEVGFG